MKSYKIGVTMSYRSRAFLSIALAFFSCIPVYAAQAATPAEDDRKIRELDAAWSQAIKAKDVEMISTYYAADGSLLADGARIATGTTAIKGVWQYMLTTPGFDLSFTPGRVEVSRAGDMALDIGAFVLSASGPRGAPVNTVGKYVVVWKKQPNGQWRVAADIFNSDPP
jgi:uncharacterized protein (TIGR02246 family)